jgi:hypothetical protein
VSTLGDAYYATDTSASRNAIVPRKDKINREIIKASLFTLCTECGYKIPPAESPYRLRSYALPEVWRGLHSGKGQMTDAGTIDFRDRPFNR